jgi:23S rRNA (guanosine2251-2'-O)-methyltransferase
MKDRFRHFFGGDLILEKTSYLIPGFHAVRETLIQGRVTILEVWIAEGKKSARTGEILQMAGKRGITVSFKKAAELAHLMPGMVHQGVVALAEKFTYSDFNEVTDISMQDQCRALLIAADHITDEGNLGAMIRTAAFFSAHGLILPKDRSAKVTANVLKRSSGACAYLPITRVVNLGRALDLLEKKGFWIVGASGESSESVYQCDWNRDLVLILGNEQKGISRTIQKRCHQVVGIPAPGHMESLNVSVAAGVILSEIFRQREAFKTAD